VRASNDARTTSENGTLEEGALDPMGHELFEAQCHPAAAEVRASRDAQTRAEHIAPSNVHNELFGREAHGEGAALIAMA